MDSKEVPTPEVPPRHRVVEKDGYILTFYPGFLREADVWVDGQEDVLYKQELPHGIREQEDEPLKRFELKLQGGPNDRNFTLHIDDPQHAIAEIVVKLYPKGRKHEECENPKPEEEFVAKNGAILCPPYC